MKDREKVRCEKSVRPGADWDFNKVWFAVFNAYFKREGFSM